MKRLSSILLLSLIASVLPALGVSAVPQSQTGSQAHRPAPSLDDDALEAARNPVKQGAVTALHVEWQSTDLRMLKPGQQPEKHVVDITDGSFTTRAGDRNQDGLPDSIQINVAATGNQRWGLEFASWGLGTNLSVGTYDRCQNAAFSEGSAGLSINSPNCPCWTFDSGTFSVLAMEYVHQRDERMRKDNIKIRSFAARFEAVYKSATIKGWVSINAVPGEVDLTE